MISISEETSKARHQNVKKKSIIFMKQKRFLNISLHNDLDKIKKYKLRQSRRDGKLIQEDNLCVNNLLYSPFMTTFTCCVLLCLFIFKKFIPGCSILSNNDYKYCLPPHVVYSLDGLHCKKRLTVFPVPSWDVIYQTSLDGNIYIW